MAAAPTATLRSYAPDVSFQDHDPAVNQG